MIISLFLLAVTVVGLVVVVTSTHGNKFSSEAAGKALLMASSVIAGVGWGQVISGTQFTSPYSGEVAMLLPTILLWVVVGVDSLSPSTLTRRLTVAFGYVFGGGLLLPSLFGHDWIAFQLTSGNGLFAALIPGVAMIVGATLLASSEAPSRDLPITPTPPGVQQHMPVQTSVPAPPVQPAVVASLAPANWYPDPSGLQVLRYWDGMRWTDHQQPIPAPSGPAQ